MCDLCLLCPRFGWDRVNFHKKLGGLTQTSQSNGIFDTMWYHAWYLSGTTGQERIICYLRVSLALRGEKTALCIFFFLSVLCLLFSSPSVVLLNCLYLNPQVLPFSSGSCPHPTREEE